MGKDGLSFQDKPLDSSVEALTEFATELHIRQVRKFGFHRNLDERDYMDFLSMLLIPADQFRTGKKIEEYFRARQISTIYVNEVNFAKVFLGKKLAELAEETQGDEESKDFAQARLWWNRWTWPGTTSRRRKSWTKSAANKTAWPRSKNTRNYGFITGAVSDFYDLKKDRFPACERQGAFAA